MLQHHGGPVCCTIILVLVSDPNNHHIEVVHQLPYSAIMKARDCYDPRIFGPEDDVEEVDIGDGEMVTLRRDWFRPHKEGRGPCTEKDVPEPCSCGRCVQPQGVCALLYWDKINLANR